MHSLEMIQYMNSPEGLAAARSHADPQIAKLAKALGEEEGAGFKALASAIGEMAGLIEDEALRQSPNVDFILADFNRLSILIDALRQMDEGE